MVYCSGLESQCRKPQESAENAQICDKSDAHDALFMLRSARRVGAKVGTPEDPDWQRHYEELGFIRSRREELFADHSDEQLVALFAVLSRELGIPSELPLPPHGLPGISAHPDELVMEIIRLGAQYAVALADGERRTLWNIHERISEILRAEWWRGRTTGERYQQAQFIAKVNAEIGAASERRVEQLVYFIQSATGDIKIGMAVDVKARLKGLQTAHPVKLELLASTGGGREQEKAYHTQFADHRLHGEWFAPHPDILAEIERLKETANA